APGQARSIVTGGVPPEGTDAVLPSELGEVRDGMLNGEAPPGGRHVRPAGEAAAEADVLVSAGTVLTPPRQGILPTPGHYQRPLRRAPLVHLVVTGDALVGSGVPQPGQVRDVMSPMLPPLLVALGAKVSHVDRAHDDVHAVASRATTSDADIIVSAGG